MIVYIYSQLSGKASQNRIEEVTNELKTIYPNLYSYPFDEIDKINKDDLDIVLFSGGDGSFSNIINYFHDYLDKITFGYIPMGTANDIARNFGIKSAKDGINIIRRGLVKEETLLEINDRLFMYGVSAGEMSSVSTGAKTNEKKHYGKIVYKIRGIRYLFKKKNNILIDGKEEKLKVLIIARTKYLGGVRINRNFDGRLRLYKIKNIFDIIGLFIFGRFKKTNNRIINNVRVNCKSIWCIDGERIDTENGVIRISDKKIKMLSKNA